jgi:perosamine synthetase
MLNKPIPLSLPSIDEAEARAVTEVLASGWVTQGPRVAAFEAVFARYTGAASACAVSNCTTALHLALLGVGVEPGDVVLTVSLSFIATANAIRHASAEPVFVEIDPGTLNLCPEALESSLREDFEARDGRLWYRHIDRLLRSPTPLRKVAGPVGRLAAVLAVHQLGMPCDLSRLGRICADHRVPLVEDAACASGSEYSLDAGRSWRRVGQPVGEVACFSFHPRKVITTGDGGMLTTNRADLDRQFRLLRQHGMSVSDAARHGTRQVIFEDYEVTGFNHRMTDLQGAMGQTQLEKLPGIVEQRRSLAALYRESLAKLPVRLPAEPPYARANWQSYQVQLADPAIQRPVMQRLLDQGIATRRGVMCSHREPPYRDAWPEGSLPASEWATRTGLILPLYPALGEEDVRRVAAALAEALGQENTSSRGAA